MSTDDLIREACALLRLALYCWGGCVIAAVVLGYVFGNLGGRDRG
jgi:hypothetical protein